MHKMKFTINRSVHRMMVHPLTIMMATTGAAKPQMVPWLMSEDSQQPLVALPYVLYFTPAVTPTGMTGIPEKNAIAMNITV